MPIPLNVLIVEDSEDDALLIVSGLQRGGYEPRWERVESAGAMDEALARGRWDIVISDYVMPQFDGFAAMDHLRSSGQDAPFIIVSGNIGEDVAVEAMRAGAQDYIMKDNLKRLVPAVDRELQEAAVRRAQKAAQDELAAAQALLEQVFSISQVMVAYMDPSFNYIRVNPAYAETFGRQPDEFPGRNHLALFPEIGDEAVLRRVLETGRAESSQGLSYRARSAPGGGSVYMNRSVHRLTALDGQVIGLVLILLDTTHEVLLELQTRQAQKMEALGTLAGGIAHDFNNILATIVINAEMALNEGRRSAADEHHLPLILQAADRGKDLVKQVLAFSRKKVREPRPVALGPVVREALSFLRASLPSTIEIRDEVAADGGVILADVTEIYQVVMNLGSNAAYAMRRQGGVLTLATASVELDGDDEARLKGLGPGPYMKLTVADTGEGIPPDILPRIFDPFFTTKGLAEGTGMGLPVVHGIIAASGGAIGVSSEVGKGSVFEVYFPRLPGAPAEAKAATADIPRGHERVLVVDDERNQAEGLRDMLGLLGYHATFETDSERALALIRDDPQGFDIVVTDQTMPHMTGTKLATEARSIRGDLPVILCTGYSDDVSDAAASSHSIREILMKPFTVQEIATALRRALEPRTV